MHSKPFLKIQIPIFMWPLYLNISQTFNSMIMDHLKIQGFCVFQFFPGIAITGKDELPEFPWKNKDFAHCPLFLGICVRRFFTWHKTWQLA